VGIERHKYLSQEISFVTLFCDMNNFFQCKACGQWFQKTSNYGPPNSTCSDRCRQRYARGYQYYMTGSFAPKRHQYEQRCAVCEKQFFSYRSDAKTCSPRCRQALACQNRKTLSHFTPEAIRQAEIDRIKELHRRARFRRTAPIGHRSLSLFK
jgi:hypothetical protein